VGKIFGVARAMKGGIGTASLARGRLRVAALAVVNAFGDIRDPATGLLVAGARDGVRGNRLLGTEAWLREGKARGVAGADNTTLAVVATNARLDREQASRLAAASNVALARCVAPAHTLYDGDLVFSLATGSVRVDPLTLETMAVEALCRAILRGVVLARGLAGVPSWHDLRVSSP
jgi:L-aminopeptidase/D-esterase-like protein